MPDRFALYSFYQYSRYQHSRNFDYFELETFSLQFMRACTVIYRVWFFVNETHAGKKRVEVLVSFGRFAESGNPLSNSRRRYKTKECSIAIPRVCLSEM